MLLNTLYCSFSSITHTEIGRKYMLVICGSSICLFCYITLATSLFTEKLTSVKFKGRKECMYMNIYNVTYLLQIATDQMARTHNV